MSTKQNPGKDHTRKDRTRIGQIQADPIPDDQEKSVLSTPSAFYFAAEYSVQVEILSLLYDDLSSFFAEIAAGHPSQIAAAVWTTMEIAANIVEHGHPQPDPDATFHVEAIIYPDRCEIILRDRGVVFDCALLERAILPSDWQTHKRGGLGLSLGRRVVDELSYTRKDGVNLWKIVVRSA